MDKEKTLAKLEELSKETLMKAINITYTDVGEDFLYGKMPVSNLTKQPFGILHGGATAALIETLASAGSFMHIDTTKQFAAGLELNVNHVRAVKEGFVFGKAHIVHKGRSTHVWRVDVTNNEGKTVALGRMTMLIKTIKD